MAEQEVKLMKGNEALAHAAIRCGCDGYFGYPITPQTEVIETLSELKPWETTGMVVLQAESEVASINMLYGGGGNGDYYILVLAPNSVQEMADFVDLSFELAFKYRIPAMILSDGVIGQMMEKVVLPPFKPRRTNEEIIKECPWAATGCKGRKPVVITSLELQEKYRKIRENEVRYETKFMDDAEYMIVAFGSAARIAEKTIELARAEGIKVGLFRPITLWPFPEKEIAEAAKKLKGILVAEINAGMMIEDVRLAVNGTVRCEHYGRLGGIVPEPEEMVKALKEKFL